MYKKLITLVLTLIAVNISTSDPVPWVTKCHSSDADCIRQNAVANAELFTKGLPEYNVEPLDPITFKSLDCSTNNMKLIFSDVVIKGLSKCNIKKLSRNTEKSTISVKLQCDIIGDGNYEVNGKLLLLPIEGKGDFHAAIRKVEMIGEINVENYTGKDGKEHLKITTWTHEYKVHGKSKLKFNNLFNGNQALSKTIEDVIDNNANALLEDIAGPVVSALISRITKNISAFLKFPSIEDLSLDN